MERLKLFVITGLACVLGACAQFALVENQPQEVAGIYTVQPQMNWSRAKWGSREVLWTIDGVRLQLLQFPPVLEQGDSLFTAVGKNDTLPVFRTGMTASEVMEFVVDSLDATGYSAVEARELEPFKFSGLDGFRFHLNFRSEGGLDYAGLAAGAIKNNELYLVLYTGTQQHYYGQYEDHVERMLSTIRVIGDASQNKRKVRRIRTGL